MLIAPEQFNGGSYKTIECYFNKRQLLLVFMSGWWRLVDMIVGGQFDIETCLLNGWVI